MFVLPGLNDDRGFQSNPIFCHMIRGYIQKRLVKIRGLLKSDIHQNFI